MDFVIQRRLPVYFTGMRLGFGKNSGKFDIVINPCPLQQWRSEGGAAAPGCRWDGGGAKILPRNLKKIIY